jgi:hypothetical protein
VVMTSNKLCSVDTRHERAERGTDPSLHLILSTALYPYNCIVVTTLPIISPVVTTLPIGFHSNPGNKPTSQVYYVVGGRLEGPETKEESITTKDKLI